MQANPKFSKRPPEFWAHVRLISQQIGYTTKGKKTIRVPSIAEIAVALQKAPLSLSTSHIASHTGKPTAFGRELLDYFEFRAHVLNATIQAQLMDKDAAQKEFLRLRARLKSSCPLPMNKQKGDKKKNAYLTCMVNMLVEAGIGDAPCDYDPRSLTTITHGGKPLRTLARRVDGAFPAVVNPVAIWEVKEYYHTTTFGSRVADGVYESLLDGMEIEELERAGHQRIDHVLFVDGRYTWWECGRSYLCRLVDMLHMGYVDEVIFGSEVLSRLPLLAKDWARRHRANVKARSVNGLAVKEPDAPFSLVA